MEKSMVEWAKIAQELAKAWAPSMAFRSNIHIKEEDVYDFLMDLWIERGGKGKEFEEAHRGNLYAYTLSHVGHSRDALFSACAIEDIFSDNEIKEDRLGFLSYTVTSETEIDPELDAYLSKLDALQDLSAALAGAFGISDRRGRTFSADIRREKIKALILDAARKRGLSRADIKKLATKIMDEHLKKGGDASEIEVLKIIATSAKKPPSSSRVTKSQGLLSHA